MEQQENIQVPYMTLLHLGITSCPHCFVEMQPKKPLDTQKCPGCNLSLYMPLILDDYILYKPLGTGGVGHVYKAMKKREKGRYAIKLFHCGKEHSEDNEHPIVREATSGHSVGKHPNLVPVLQFGNAKDEFYIVFPFIEGERLDEYISRKKHLSEKRAFNIMAQIIAAEEHICSKGYLFRDIKPENIILEKDGTVKICDYGLCVPLNDAKIHGGDFPDEIEGSPFYIPPERILGTSEGEFSEIYSLGMLLFHCLAGKTYFSETDIDELVSKHINELHSESAGIHLNNCHEKTIKIINKMIKKDPALRYQNFESLKADIQMLEKELLQKPSLVLKRKKS